MGPNQKVSKNWRIKIVKVISSFEGLRLSFSLGDAISFSTDLRLDDLMEIAELAISMAVSHRKRVRSLTKDASTALKHTCKRVSGIAEIFISKISFKCIIGKIYN